MSKEKTFIIVIDDCPENLKPEHIHDAIIDYLLLKCHVEEAIRIPLEMGDIVTNGVKA